MRFSRILLALLPLCGYAQITFDAAVDGGNNGGSGTLTWTHTCSGSNRLLVINITGDTATDGITGVTYNGVSASLVTKLAPDNSGDLTGGRWQYMYYLLNPASGSHSVSITISGTQYIVGQSASWTGVNQSSAPISSASALTLNSSPVTKSLTTTADNAIVIMGIWAFTNLIPETNSTSRVIDSAFTAGGILEASSDPITPPGNVDMAFSWSPSAAGAAIMASFGPPSANVVRRRGSVQQ